MKFDCRIFDEPLLEFGDQHSHQDPRLGLIDAVPQSLLLADATATPTMAAKRIFGIGDPLLIGRRAGELAAEAGIGLTAFDLGLQNWGAPDGERVAAGSSLPAEPDPTVRAPIAAALRVD